jgi:hypothetical protein
MIAARMSKIMMHNCRAVVFALSALSLAAADLAWKAKQFSEWTEDDAKEVMTDSPWAKTVMPTLAKSADQVSPAAEVAEAGLMWGVLGSDSPAWAA